MFLGNDFEPKSNSLFGARRCIPQVACSLIALRSSAKLHFGCLTSLARLLQFSSVRSWLLNGRKRALRGSEFSVRTVDFCTIPFRLHVCTVLYHEGRVPVSVFENIVHQRTAKAAERGHVKKRQKVSNIFLTFFAQGKKRQK